MLEDEPALDGSFDIEPPEGALLEPEDAEPDGEDGRLLLEDEPLEERSREAPGPAPLSQPYSPLTATAMGKRTNADFFKRLIWTLLSVRLGLHPSRSNYRAHP